MRMNTKYKSGFTIIEVLVVVAIIGILATVVIISYGGIQAKAIDAGVLSDIDAMDGLQTNYGVQNKVAGKAYYSGSGYDSDLRFKPSNDNVIDVVINGEDYCIRGYNPKGTKKTIYDAFEKESKTGVCALLAPSSAATGITTVTIGSQVWMAKNLDTGTMLTAPASMTDNSVIEKYCFDNDQANCDQYGALYTWNEATQYGGDDICPDFYHLPSDDEWKTLEAYLNMPSEHLDITGWLRGQAENVGTKLKVGGSSGFEAKLAGIFWSGSFEYQGGVGGYWSSTGSSIGINRILEGPSTYVGRFDNDAGFGDYRSVRCLRN